MNKPSNDTGAPDPKLDQTIDTLCAGLKPCKPCNPFYRSVAWMFIAVCYVSGISWLIGLQPNTLERLNNHIFLFEILLSFVTGVMATIATFMLTIPDARNKDWFLSIPGTLFFVHMLWMLVRWYVEGCGVFPPNWFGHCWMDCVIMAGIPAAFVLILIRKGATVRPRYLAFNAILAIASFSWIGMRFVCPFETVGKVYFVNFLPYLVAGIIFGAVARKFLRW